MIQDRSPLGRSGVRCRRDRGVRRPRIRVLLILDYGNALYEGMAPPCSDPARAAFAAFSGAAARHFRGRAAWEVWNEPNVPRYWMGAPDALCYFALARDAAAAIRREDPSREPETAAQAEYLVRALAVNRSGGIPLTIWYCWQEPVLPWNSFDLLDVHGRAKAAYQALQSLRAR